MLKTKEEVEKWLKIHNVSNYEIQNDLTVDVNSGVYLNYMKVNDPYSYYFEPIASLPVRFGRVMGDFIICDNELSTLTGCPTFVEGDFDCSNNNLTSLIDSPLEVLEHFSCEHNNLNSLTGAPKIIGAGFSCFANPLEELGDIETRMATDSTFICYPLKEFGYSKIYIDGDDFNDKVQELKRIREEKALFESSVAKVLDTPQLGATSQQAKEPQQQTRAKPKFKL